MDTAVGSQSGPLKTRLVVEYGVELDGVWLPIPMLRRLAAHGPWDTPFTEATIDQARVLVAHSLAERHSRGLYRGIGLTGFLDAIPFEPTVPFPVVPGKQPGRSTTFRDDQSHPEHGQDRGSGTASGS